MRKKVVLAGSGISVAPPSNLPSWWGYNKELISAIKEKALEQCPGTEDLLAAIDIEKNLPVQCVSEIIVSHGAGDSYFPLLSLLNSSKPNINHFALAELARQHKLDAIVTTNFDTLVEAAFMEEEVPLTVASKPDDIWDALRNYGCKYIKAHGTAVDAESMIDTVSQKARGLSAAVKSCITECFSNSDIYVLGFSGADLDFDINYFPFAEAIQSGSKIKWILLPSTKPHQNVIALKDKYPDRFEINYCYLPSFFSSLGVDTTALKGQDDGQRNGRETMEHMHEVMSELFSQPHIGTHGCVAYCLYLLSAIGENEKANQLADAYEKSFDHDAIHPLWVTGILGLARQRLFAQDFSAAETWYMTAVSCLNKMLEINDELFNTESIDMPVLKDRIAEAKSNLATCFCDLGLVSMYKEELPKALKRLTKAREYATSTHNVKRLGVILFNIARANFYSTNDEDAFLSELKRAADCCRSSGNLTTLTEILQEDCACRFALGEYYLAEKDIEELGTCAKNIARKDLVDRCKCLKAEYYFRNGLKEEFIKQVQSMADDPSFTWEMGSDLIFYFVLNQIDSQDPNKDNPAQKNPGDDIKALDLASLFDMWQNTVMYQLSTFRESEQLSEEKLRELLIYSQAANADPITVRVLEKRTLSCAKANKWERVLDLAECLLHNTHSEKQKAFALYEKGCGLVETHDYENAKIAFADVIKLGDSATKTHLGWAYIEIASIDAIEGATNEEYYYTGKEILSQTEEYDMICGCLRYIRALKSVNRIEEAKSLLQELLDTQIRDEYRASLEKMYEDISSDRADESIRSGDTQNVSAESIANYALRLFEDESSHEQAWELIRLAKERYLACGNMIGAAKCENNMGNFCMKESNMEEALHHFQAAFEMKFAEKDYYGAASDLCCIISVYINCHRCVDISEQVAKADLLLPLVGENIAKYRLCFSLCLYSELNGDKATAVKYAEMANSGIEQLPDDQSVAATITNEEINSVHESLNSNHSIPDPFYDKMTEAKKSFREGRVSDFDSLINELRAENEGDHYNLGRIEGQVGNIYLNNGAYAEAVKSYDKALEQFAKVTPEDHSGIEAMKTRAINEKAVALSKDGKDDECIALMKKRLSEIDLTDPDSGRMLINYCNRLLKMNNNLKVGSPAYKEIEKCIEKLGKIKNADEHLLGGYHQLRGNLCLLSNDFDGAQKEFAEALAKFRIINSPDAALSEISLAAAKIRAEAAVKSSGNNNVDTPITPSSY